MSEIRRDAIRGGWVVVVPERTRRPQDFGFRRAALPDAEHSAGLPEHISHDTRSARLLDPRSLGEGGQSRDGALCPFCEGHEQLAGRELLAWRAAGGADISGWEVRVVAHREPSLRVESNLGPSADGLFVRDGGLGAHEVIIESPRHGDRWQTMKTEAVARVLWAWRERIRDLKRDFRLKTFLVVKNHGAAAGARLDHPHSQLFAFPLLPAVVEQELAVAAKHFELFQSCVFCDAIREERALDQRVISQDEQTVVLAPFASRVPFETWILPRVHGARFEDASDALLLAVASPVQDTLRRLAKTLLDPPFNLVLHTLPAGEGAEGSFHWHLEVVPRLGPVSGIEWGSGTYVNPVPPEEAAVVLRSSL